jgi:hypothetical protein
MGFCEILLFSNHHDMCISMTPSAANDIAYYFPGSGFIYKKKGKFDTESILTKSDIIIYLEARNIPAKEAKLIINKGQYIKIADRVMAPGQPPLVHLEGSLFNLNTWIAPTISPIEHPWPNIQKVIDWLTDLDTDGQLWLTNWLSAKMQNPLYMSKIAVVFTTEPGGGKGTLAKIIRYMLGFSNTSTIGTGDLSDRFNASWVEKLFVFADEITTAENRVDIENRLKIAIDSTEYICEAKNINKRRVPNYASWMIASNDHISPVIVKPGDRRYTIFSNSQEVSLDYQKLLRSFWQQGVLEEPPTPEFEKEIKGFLYYLQNYPIDFSLISGPYNNKYRDSLISSGKEVAKEFVRLCHDGQVDALLAGYINKGKFTFLQKGDYDFGEDGLSLDILYPLFQDFSNSGGNRGLVKKTNLLNHFRASSYKFKIVDRIDSDGKEIVVIKVPRK